MLTALLAAGKETWVLFAVAWLIAAGACGLLKWRALRFAPVAAGVFLLAILFLFGGEGFLNFWRSYFVYETDPGHHKPVWYFVKILFPDGRWSGEPWLWFGLLGALGLWSRSRLAAIPLEARFLGLTGLFAILIFSFIPYKTPWLMMLPLALCLPPPDGSLPNIGPIFFNGPLWSSSSAWWPGRRTAPGSSARSGFSIPESPWSILPALTRCRPSALIFKGLIGTVRSPSLAPTTWPLPWYLRGFTNVGYFDDLSAEIPPGFSTYLLCDEAMEKTAPAGEERLWGVRTDYLMRSLVINPDAPGTPR